MKTLDLTGIKFGRLTGISLVPRDGKKWHNRWLCKCECGKSKISSVNNLRSGSVRSCGCLKSEVASATAKITGHKRKGEKRLSVSREGTAFRMLFHSYRKDAGRRGYVFTISPEELKILTSSACFYCGNLPTDKFKKVSTFGEVYIYNGVDRVINSEGYIPGNVVSCCNFCNKAKHTATKQNFLSWVERVYNNRVVVDKQNAI